MLPDLFIYWELFLHLDESQSISENWLNTYRRFLQESNPANYQPDGTTHRPTVKALGEWDSVVD